MKTFDYVVIGSGMGGSIVTRHLVGHGATVCLLERGSFVRQEQSNWDIVEVAVKKKYQATETWYDRLGKPIHPRLYYNVGGASRFYGAAAFRLRRKDFETIHFPDGDSPSWPFAYDDLAPYYTQAEALLGVHGRRGEDPTDPGGDDYPFPPIEHEHRVADLEQRLRVQGLRPFHTPLAIDFGPGGRCQKGSPCDGFPCFVRAKGDAENRVLRPLLLKKPENLTLITEARVDRILTDGSGTRAVAVGYQKEGQYREITGKTIVLSAGALNSALILLDSRNKHHPRGLANSSGQVGRNYLCHNNSVLMAIHPFRRNRTRLQKTLACNDYYLSGGTNGTALGHFQLRGKVQPQMLRHHPRLLVRLFRSFLARHSIDLWVMSEDLPRASNRIYRDQEGRVRLERSHSNTAGHRELVAKVRKILHRAGFPMVIITHRGLESVQHQTGTIRMGNDAKRSVLDPACRSHDIRNLFVVDGSFFPSCGAVNPALTIAAQALKAAERMLSER